MTTRDQSLSRRALLSGAAAAYSAAGRQAAAADKPAAGLSKIAIFSKHLQFLQGDALAACAAEIGFDGFDLTVRRGGHVAPERVRQELPKLVSIIRKQNLDIPMITTDIADAESPFAGDIVATMQELGIRNYRWTGLKFRPDTPMKEQLDRMKPRVAKLAELNARHNVAAMYHTHSGVDLVGASIWDLHILLDGLDPKSVGVNYDVGHATIEGGVGGWIHSFRITGPYLLGAAVKDYVWEKDAKGAWKPKWTPLGEGMVQLPQFFRMLAAARFSGPLVLHFEYAAGNTREAVIPVMKRDLEKMRTLIRAVSPAV